MIEFVRKRKKGIVNFILLGLAVILMVSFGIESFAPSTYQRQVAVTLNGEEIPRYEFDRRLRSMEQLYQNQFGAAFDKIRSSFNLPQKIADQMIDERLLSNFFDALGFTTSVPQIENRIAQIPYFNGKVDPDSFRSYLRGTGLTEAALEAAIRKEVLEGEFQNTLAHLLAPTDRELSRLAEIQNEEARFLSAKLPVSQFEGSVTLTKEEVEKYYQDHTADFTVEKSGEFEFIRLQPSLFLARVEVNEEDLRQFYSERQDEFREAEQIHLSQVTFGLDSESASEPLQSALSPNDKKKQIAQSIIDRAKKGEQFDALVREFAEKDEEKKSGGDLGWKKSSELDDEMLAALEDLKPGEVSGIVETADAIRVLFLHDRKESKLKSFEEVRPELERGAKLADAPLYLEVEAERALDELRSEKLTLDELAKRFSVPMENSTSAQLSAEIRREASSREEQEFGKSADGPSVVLYRVRKIIPERVKPLEDVRGQIEAALRKEKARAFAQEQLSKTLAELKTRSDFESKFRSLNAELSETEFKKRGELTAPFLDSLERTGELYRLSTQQPVLQTPLLVGENVFAVMLTEKKSGTGDPRSVLLLEAKATGERAVDALVQILRRDSEIEVNPEVLQQSES